MELVTNAPANNFTLKLSLDIPQLIGNQRYWVQILNDSSKVWVETGFGNIVMHREQKTIIPLQLAASGFYISGSGAAFLEYYSDNTGVFLTLIGGK